MKFPAILAFLFLSGLNLFAQQLFINEVSQGPSGAFEYVELIVVGTPSCQTPPPCLDMRGIIIDDNNGYFESGSGSGIAQGALRFANITFWECIPIGTLIVVYNESNRNTAIPADDISMADGNGRLIIPGSSNLLEQHSSLPSSANNNYSATGWVTGGAWNTVGMANGQDSYQIRQTTSSTTPSHAVSWGSNNQNTIIYFAGNAGGLVFSMKNVTDDNPSLQANWVSEQATAGQTPGVANSTQNAAWIAAISNTSGGTISLDVSSTNTGCGSNCTGTASVVASGGATPYTYDWSNGGTTAAITNLCAQTYTIEVTDANGCTATEQVTVSAGTNTMTINTTATNVSCNNACNGSVSATVSGGAIPYTYAWSNGASTASVGNLCAQTYTVIVTDANGCTANGQAIVGTNPNPLTLTPSATNESCENLCDGTASIAVSGGATPYTYTWSNGMATPSIQNLCDGTYTITVTDQNNCQSSATATVSPGASGQTPIVSPINPLTTTDDPIQVVASITGGTWSASCTSCINNSGVFNPQTAGVGTHQVCYTVGSGACAETACISIIVTQGCSTQQTSESINACPGESIVFDGQEITVAGNYDFNYLTANGCDSIHTVQFSFFATNPLNDFKSVCLGDSALVNGNWYHESTLVNYETVDGNGCILQNTATISMYDCQIPPYYVFIPNTFTPNGDFVNDVFPISITGGLLDNGFIMNRWGQVVKEFSETDLSWDGRTQSGEAAPDGVYTYVVVVEKAGGVKEKYHGFVTLIR